MPKVLAFLASLFAAKVCACSVAMCAGGGVEMRRSFVVHITHEGRAIRGVRVRVATYLNDPATEKFAGVTGVDGAVRVIGLMPGEYWIEAEMLGFDAAYHCFHVSEHASLRAKRNVSYTWGDYSTWMTGVSGKLTDVQPGKGENQVWNLIHGVDVPIRGASVKLHNALTGADYETKSTQEGAFSFPSLPDGTYALHIEGGEGGRTYEASDFLIKITRQAKRSALDLRRTEDVCGLVGLRER